MIDHEQKNDQIEPEFKIADDQTDEKSKWKNLKKTLNDREILAQALLFANAGHDTTAYALSFIAYNLAIHPEYQQLLCDEVDDILDKYVI